MEFAVCYDMKIRLHFNETHIIPSGARCMSKVTHSYIHIYSAVLIFSLLEQPHDVFKNMS